MSLSPALCHLASISPERPLVPGWWTQLTPNLGVACTLPGDLQQIANLSQATLSPSIQIPSLPQRCPVP